MVQASGCEDRRLDQVAGGALLISASPGPMAAEHESLRLRCRADAAGLDRLVARLPRIRRISGREWRRDGCKLQTGTDPAFACAAPGPGTIPPG